MDAIFEEKARVLLDRCLDSGHVMSPYCKDRNPYQQARLWRQSRSAIEIERAITKLKQKGAPFLSHVLNSVGPQYGRWATNALPGQSWHQWGLAVDCFLVSPEGKAIWSAKHPGYKCYAEIARDLGLTAGHFWKHPDSVHVQAPSVSVRTLKSWKEIDAEMRRLHEII